MSYIHRTLEQKIIDTSTDYSCLFLMRLLIYTGRLYEKNIATSEYYPYSRTLQSAPRPHCVCFYNGTAEQLESRVLKLSEAFGGEADIEVRVTMLNINYGKNRKLMEVCKPLSEYDTPEIDQVVPHEDYSVTV